MPYIKPRANRKKQDANERNYRITIRSLPVDTDVLGH